MPTVSNVNLTLTTVNTQVTIRVTYDVEFTTFERKLTDLGLSYDTHVTIHDFDGGDTPGAEILDFYPGRYVLPVTSGTGSQDLVRGTSPGRCPGRSLQVDPVGNDDELKAVVRVHANQWLDSFTEDAVSDQEILLGMRRRSAAGSRVRRRPFRRGQTTTAVTSRYSQSMIITPSSDLPKRRPSSARS